MSDDQHVWLAELATVRLEVDVLTRVSNMVAEEVRRTGLSDDADSIVTQALTCWCLLSRYGCLGGEKFYLAREKPARKWPLL